MAADELTGGILAAVRHKGQAATPLSALAPLCARGRVVLGRINARSMLRASESVQGAELLVQWINVLRSKMQPFAAKSAHRAAASAGGGGGGGGGAAGGGGW